jgi:hypothetical protein
MSAAAPVATVISGDVAVHQPPVIANANAPSEERAKPAREPRKKQQQQHAPAPAAAKPAPASKEIVPIHVGADLVDIGVNLTDKRYQKDFDVTLQRARRARVSRQIITGTSLQGSRDAVALAVAHQEQQRQRQCDGDGHQSGSESSSGALYATVGIHPHDAARIVRCEI